ncbi:hypothetical protein MKX01_000450 [Papaver californicum]|nr:hypothetical protein MKX01_000450 [Papaver californicum]
MYCSICKNRSVTLKHSSSSPSKNGVAVCDSCYGQFNSMMNLMNKKTYSRYVTNWVSIDDSLLGSAAFTEERHSDILVKPGDGLSIPAHKFLLATRSEVFNHMLSSDTCKTAQIDSVCLPEFNHEELETFLEFLYCGNLAKEKFEMHYYSLALASHKYAIPHFEKFCEEYILKLLDSSNTFKVLEISEICSNETLRVAAVKSILDHKEEITGSPGFEEFAIQNPQLMVHTVRLSSTQPQLKKRKNFL